MQVNKNLPAFMNLKGKGIVHSIYQIQFVWWTRFFSNCAEIMELNSRIY